VISDYEFDFNICFFVQHEDTLLLSHENGQLTVFDWNVGKIIEEIDDFGWVQSAAVWDGGIIFGDKEGGIKILS